MLLIKKIQGVWAVVNDRTRDILECFDTKPEAEDYYEPYRIQKALEEFDKTRTWKSLYDEERRQP